MKAVQIGLTSHVIRGCEGVKEWVILLTIIKVKGVGL